jgi:hypothetical protein
LANRRAEVGEQQARAELIRSRLANKAAKAELKKLLKGGIDWSKPQQAKTAIADAAFKGLLTNRGAFPKDVNPRMALAAAFERLKAVGFDINDRRVRSTVIAMYTQAVILSKKHGRWKDVDPHDPMPPGLQGPKT